MTQNEILFVFTQKQNIKIIVLKNKTIISLLKTEYLVRLVIEYKICIILLYY